MPPESGFIGLTLYAHLLPHCLVYYDNRETIPTLPA